MVDEVNILAEATPVGAGAGADLNAAIARRISVTRRERGLTFDHLAVRSGVSKSMLVQIEQGRANPSIATLCKVAAGLGLSVAELISAAEEGYVPVRVVTAAQSSCIWQGPAGGSATLLAGSDGPDLFELWLWEMRAGERYVAEPHPPGTQELLHVLDGELRLEVDATEFRVDAGASVFAHTDRPHAYACRSEGGARFFMVVFQPALPESRLRS
jgi:transcriptional regulator with XRE-family HTH domain